MRPSRLAGLLASVIIAAFYFGDPAAARTAASCVYTDGTPQQKFVGVAYETVAVTCSAAGHTSLAHVLQIDVSNPKVTLVSSSAQPFTLTLPSDLVASGAAQVAVNANLFSNCCRYVAITGNQTLLRGWEVSEGKTLSPVQGNRPPPPNSAAEAARGFLPWRLSYA